MRCFGDQECTGRTSSESQGADLEWRLGAYGHTMEDGGKSRDAGRIDVVLAMVRSVWAAYPDLRLSQLIVNAAKSANRDVVSPELFSLEDDSLLLGLEKYLEQLQAREQGTAPPTGSPD